MHHAGHDDHLRPILLCTEGGINYDLEPVSGAADLAEMSGKMYVANIDPDQSGIHGYRMAIADDKNLQMTPIWSFSSPGAKIRHFLPKPTEEIVHSQGNGASRSVLLKYS